MSLWALLNAIHLFKKIKVTDEYWFGDNQKLEVNISHFISFVKELCQVQQSSR